MAIPRQLRDGIRGLLFDTHYGHRTAGGTVVTDDVRTPASQVYLCHETCEIGATPLVSVLRAIRRFLRHHPRNVLVIDNEDDVTPHDVAREVARSGLGHVVYRGKPGPRWPTLRAMIARRQQAVMLAEHDAAGVSFYHAAYDGILQETPYTWDQPALITRRADWPASCLPNRGGRHGSLFLMNHWSPPVPPPTPDPAAGAKVNATRVLVGRAKACRNVRGRLPNLVAVDMYRSGGLFAAVRRLNALQR